MDFGCSILIIDLATNLDNFQRNICKANWRKISALLFTFRNPSDVLSVRYNALQDSVTFNGAFDHEEEAIEENAIQSLIDPEDIAPDDLSLRQFIEENTGKMIFTIFCIAMVIVIFSLSKLIYSFFHGK